MDPRVGRGLYRPAIDFITGGRLGWAKMPDVHETACFGDDVYPWYSSPEKNIEWVGRLFPNEGNVRAYYVPVCSLMQPLGGQFLQGHAATRFAGSCSHQREGLDRFFAGSCSQVGRSFRRVMPPPG